ncbi:MAG: permease [Desulfobacteraceae bacterium]|jgi:uncharacterized membrane protein YraQ (UPF0718 family)|nr:permease [Desulfobacteraceae bacterium]
MNQHVKKIDDFTPARVKKDPSLRDAVWLQFLIGAGGIYLWCLVYGILPQFSRFMTYTLFNIGRNTNLGAALEFFFYDTPKVMMLLVLVVFGVGIIRTFFTPERTRDILSGKSQFVGNIMAASLGIVTPFCSCSAVPLFIGFVTAGVPLGVTFSFLIAAPLVNEIAVGLLYGLLGWKVAGIYMATGLTIAIMAGWIIGRLHLETYIEDWVVKLNVDTAAVSQIKLMWRDRILAGWEAVKEIVGKVWVYMIIGIAVGAGIHGYVPEGFMAAIMGKGAWWAVPVAVGMGVPMYSNAAGIIPVVEALLGKGAALGTVLAFMMSVIALSLPEMIILRKVLKPQLIAVFVGVVTGGILIVGYLFNILI